ncbi:MAG: hypothetical protein NUW37_10785 [Planctomycetes bacterium]|nr:hypothetical protein [Planctomycetota bacterium]
MLEDVESAAIFAGVGVLLLLAPYFYYARTDRAFPLKFDQDRKLFIIPEGSDEFQRKLQPKLEADGFRADDLKPVDAEFEGEDATSERGAPPVGTEEIEIPKSFVEWKRDMPKLCAFCGRAPMDVYELACEVENKVPEGNSPDSPPGKGQSASGPKIYLPLCAYHSRKYNRRGAACCSMLLVSMVSLFGGATLLLSDVGETENEIGTWAISASVLIILIGVLISRISKSGMNVRYDEGAKVFIVEHASDEFARAITKEIVEFRNQLQDDAPLEDEYESESSTSAPDGLD